MCRYVRNVLQHYTHVLGYEYMCVSYSIHMISAIKQVGDVTLPAPSGEVVADPVTLLYLGSSK